MYKIKQRDGLVLYISIISHKKYRIRFIYCTKQNSFDLDENKDLSIVIPSNNNIIIQIVDENETIIWEQKGFIKSLFLTIMANGEVIICNKFHSSKL